jgi:protein-tyrosine phosphatase
VARHRRKETEFRVLYVCTGNICRSPFAEILTRHLLIGRLGGQAAAAFDVSSAGVQAVVGSGIHPSTREELAPWGLHREAADRFVARQIRPPMIADAHLVLGASTGTVPWWSTGSPRLWPRASVCGSSRGWLRRSIRPNCPPSP